jgi:hypothetical protein
MLKKRLSESLRKKPLPLRRLRKSVKDKFRKKSDSKRRLYKLKLDNSG